MQLTYGPAAITEKKEMLAISIEHPESSSWRRITYEGKLPWRRQQSCQTCWRSWWKMAIDWYGTEDERKEKNKEKESEGREKVESWNGTWVKEIRRCWEKKRESLEGLRSIPRESNVWNRNWRGPLMSIDICNYTRYTVRNTLITGFVYSRYSRM